MDNPARPKSANIIFTSLSYLNNAVLVRKKSAYLSKETNSFYIPNKKKKGFGIPKILAASVI